MFVEEVDLLITSEGGQQRKNLVFEKSRATRLNTSVSDHMTTYDFGNHTPAFPSRCVVYVTRQTNVTWPSDLPFWRSFPTQEGFAKLVVFFVTVIIRTDGKRATYRVCGTKTKPLDAK